MAGNGEIIQEELGAGLSDALTPGVNMPHPSYGFGFNIQLLTKIAGSGRAAARAMGVAESTFRGWRNGIIPRQNHSRRLMSAARELARGPLFTEVWNNTRTLAIKATVKYSGDKRKRTIYPGRFIPRFVVQGILKSWLAGEEDQAIGRAIIRAIDSYYQPFQFDQVDRVFFE